MNGPVRVLGGARALACALLALLSVAAVGAPALPALGDARHPQHHPGKLIWADLVTPDLAAAERFYGEMFGWRFEPAAGMVDYVLASVDGRPLAGIAQRTPPAGKKRQPAWLPYFAVRDVDASVKVAWRAGAALLAAARSYPGRGRQAAMRDPEGAPFGLLASTGGDPPDLLAEPGEWIWNSLITQDPASDAGFYQQVFGYEVFELPGKGAEATGGDAVQHLILSSEDYARSSVNGMPPQAERRIAHWISFVRVTDVEAAAAKATALGGRVLVEPRIDRHGGKVAVVGDPFGAPVGLMEWIEGSPNGEAK